MIDDINEAMALKGKMEASLPIPARPTSALVRALREQGVKIKSGQTLRIDSVFYMGDEGGIGCGLRLDQEGKEVTVASLTHLRVSSKHPLAKEIRHYQRKRTQRLAQSGRQGQPSSFTIHPKKGKDR